jgi:hypothetical protein
MTAPFTGGCMCGAIRYECSAEPLATGNCHCRDCQRSSGSAFVPGLFVLQEAVKITGEVKYYDMKADSGHTISRGFCPNCRAPLFGISTSLPGVIGIRAGSLDNPSWHRPAMDFYTVSAQPWDSMNPDLPKFPKLPQRRSKCRKCGNESRYGGEVAA